MKKYNISEFDTGGLLRVLHDHQRSDRHNDRLYLTKMSNGEFEKSIPTKASLLREFYIKVLKELYSFPYKNDVLDENLNLLLKVNSSAQR
ncbi:hypothetical protein HDR60_04365 [bacterium]|nr:hypothetical protein [bacterium]